MRSWTGAWMSVFLLSWGCFAMNRGAADAPLDDRIDRAMISFRIGVPLALSDERFRELTALLEKYEGVTDEVTFFTSATHAPLPAEVIEQRSRLLAERMQVLRRHGYRCGINVLATIGHHNENLENSLQGAFTRMTDIHGEICAGSFCPNDERLHRYIRQIYRSAALADPDYIWIDDDVRLAGHMPIHLTCFCDHCLALFEKETGSRFTRLSLQKAMDEGPMEEKLRLRNAWLEHNRNTLAQLFRLIERTVHQLRPSMPLGFMTGDRFFEGYDFDNWAKILSGPDLAPVLWRPGGGYYQDLRTDELAGKSHDIGRQVSLLPLSIRSIQSEIENFPYQRLKKAADIVVLEAASHMAAGCTGAAFNVLSMYDEPLTEYEPLVAALLQARPFFDLLARSLGRAPLSGVHTFWNKNTFVTSHLSSGSWFEGAALLPQHEIYDIGLPAAYSNSTASVVLLAKNSLYAMNREEIKALLSRGLYMDAETLQHLNDMGFADLTGFKAVKSDKMDRIEKFIDHPLNGAFIGRERDNRQSFLGWNVPATHLEKTDDQAQELSGLIDYSGRPVAGCTLGIFENRLGGRLCVAGYYPWTFLQNLSKSSQMKSIFRWLSRDELPAYAASFHKVNLWFRSLEDDAWALAFTNASFDAAEDLVLMVRTRAQTATFYDMQCRKTILHSSANDGEYQRFLIPHVRDWNMGLLVAGTDSSR